MKIPFLARTFGLTVFLALSSLASDAAVPSVRLVLPTRPSPVVRSIATLFAREVRERCGASVMTSGKGALKVTLALKKGLGAEGFTIVGGPGQGVRIVGNDERGLLYGVGKFLHTSGYDPAGFTPSPWRGTSVPEATIRGIYFATHFHNFYHDAPIQEVQRYVEELSLWGFNHLVFWHDMHHFNGFDDPDAVVFRQRLEKICQAATQLGLEVGFVVVANEGYGNSPAELRADVSGMRGAKFPTDICTGTAAGRQYVMDNFARLFDWAAALRPGCVWIWPYDSGGCGCAKCRPWGTNGYLRMAQPVAELAKRKLPRAKIVLSTWFLDQEEWRGLTGAFTPRPTWVDQLLVSHDTLRFAATGGPPGGLPMVNFPEISMLGVEPYGGFGACPVPRLLEGQFREARKLLVGGFPYSEGIYEDLNKVLCTQLYWQGDTPAAEIVKEYAAFEFSPTVATEVLAAVQILETNYPRRQIGPSAIQAEELLTQAAAKLTPRARQSWRWRILALRARIDRELYERKGKLEGPALKAAFDELTGIYHAQNALKNWLQPPQLP